VRVEPRSDGQKEESLRTSWGSSRSLPFYWSCPDWVWSWPQSPPAETRFNEYGLEKGVPKRLALIGNTQKRTQIEAEQIDIICRPTSWRRFMLIGEGKRRKSLENRLNNKIKILFWTCVLEAATRPPEGLKHDRVLEPASRLKIKTLNSDELFMSRSHFSFLMFHEQCVAPATRWALSRASGPTALDTTGFVERVADPLMDTFHWTQEQTSEVEPLSFHPWDTASPSADDHALTARHKPRINGYAYGSTQIQSCVLVIFGLCWGRSRAITTELI